MSAQGATAVTIIIWAKKGGRTLEVAQASGRTESRGWAKCQQEGFIAIDAAGAITVTEAGGDYLAEEMMYS